VSDEGRRVVARNRKARHEFDVLETFEAGIELKGPEVKSLRAGHVAFQDAFARVENGQVWLHSLHINPYEQANRFNVDPVRPRRLLLNRREIRQLAVKTDEKGLTLVPLEI
jgi:SsrA-binding protein